MSQISLEERQAILDPMRYYHGGPPGANPTFQDMEMYLPMVFEKIADNWKCYIKDLEKNIALEA